MFGWLLNYNLYDQNLSYNFILVFMSKQENPITTYPFKGIVIDIFEDKQQMMIKHDEVPGFMMEMTMMFNIDSSINLYNYEIGDSLNFMFNIIERKCSCQNLG